MYIEESYRAYREVSNMSLELISVKKYMVLGSRSFLVASDKQEETINLKLVA